MHTSPLDSPGRTKDAGGMNVYIRELAQELAQQDIRVDIFTRRTNEQSPYVIQVSPNVRVIHITAGPVASLHKLDLYQYTPTFARHIDEFRRHEGLQYDVIHSHYWLSGVAAMRLACYWNIPHVTMFHTLGRLKQQANPQEPEPQVRIDMEQRLLQRVDRIVAATVDERTQMTRFCGVADQRVEIIPCGVDTAFFIQHEKTQARRQTGLPLDRPLLLFAGRLDPFKGPDVLLRAAALMEEKADIVIAGGALYGDKEVVALQKLAHELQISERIHFLGARPREEMPLLYSAVDVTVVPSYHESFGLAAVESLACGTPVVATRTGGLMTVVQHDVAGFLVPRCPGFFAERLDLLLSNTQLYTRMSAAARYSILQYSWPAVAQKIKELYSDLVSTETEYSQVAL
jgi:D-inositol-3-phosphate glycosyltransferase